MTAPDKSSSLDPWAFFDKAYCISLDSRPDRLQEAKRQFAAVGLAGRVEYVIVRKNLVDQVQGIYSSHMLCLQKGLAAGARKILIFEDDILFCGFNASRLSEACHFLEKSGQWHAFFLGCMTNGSDKSETPAIRKIRFRCLAHAYAVNRPYALQLVEEKWCGLPFDELLRRRQDRFYALYPMCAFQGLAGSDNRTVLLNRLRTFFGGLPFLQKFNENYQNNKTVIISLHVMILAAGLALLLLHLR
jgi:hypothetical protein